MLAEVKYLDNFRPKIEVTESKVADLDNGYTRIANELLEAVMLANLTQHQLLVFFAIARKTYGYNKKSDWVGNEQLSKLTGMLPHKCSAAKSELVSRGILLSEKRHVSINKNIHEWKEKQAYPKKVSLPESGKKTLPESGKSDYPNQVNTKDNTTKEKKESNTPLTPQEGNGESADKPKKRSPVRINYQEYLNAYNEVVGDRLPHAIDVTEKRKRGLKKIIPKLATQNVDGWRSYVKAFVRLAKPFYFGESDSGWTADIDYLMREATLTAVREGKPSLTGR
ncbi:replication protein [Providencia rettgeri]|uniref:Replication protein n=1 Tax=Providencia rettgeri TaxID=587 RepID=A0AAE3CY63_PRORE|nr:replication protein [Providencia rettgeri]MBW3118877.1 replication protein [Providencia rettgeri]NHN54123.1 replication protein [Providencia rettgeri]